MTDFDLPDSYLMAMEVFDEAEEYENKLKGKAFFPMHDPRQGRYVTAS